MVIANSVRRMPSSKPKLIVVIPEDLKRDFGQLCHVENRSMSNMVVTLIQKAVDEARAKGLLDDQDRK
jgi:hypothetical protein